MQVSRSYASADSFHVFLTISFVLQLLQLPTLLQFDWISAQAGVMIFSLSSLRCHFLITTPWRHNSIEPLLACCVHESPSTSPLRRCKWTVIRVDIWEPTLRTGKNMVCRVSSCSSQHSGVQASPCGSANIEFSLPLQNGFRSQHSNCCLRKRVGIK